MEIGEIIQTKFRSPQIKAIVNVRYTSNYMGQYHNYVTGKYGLTMPQFNILRILRGAGKPLTVNSIKERMIERSPNSTRLMDKLIAKKMVERVRFEDDKRIVHISISRYGLEILKKIDEETDLTDAFSENLTEEEAEILSNLLDKLRG